MPKDIEEIRNLKLKAISEAIKGDYGHVVNPYGKGQASKAILDILISTDLSSMKRFYDI